MSDSRSHQPVSARGTTPSKPQGHGQAPEGSSTHSKTSLNTYFEFEFSAVVPQVSFTALKKEKAATRSRCRFCLQVRAGSRRLSVTRGGAQASRQGPGDPSQLLSSVGGGWGCRRSVTSGGGGDAVHLYVQV